MDKELRDALKAQVEARTALNNLPDDATDEKKTEARKALEAADRAVLKAIEAAEEREAEPVPRDLAQRVELRNYVGRYAQGRPVEGREAELNQGLGLDSETQVPWAALDPGPPATEERADADPPSLSAINYTTAAIMRRVFERTDLGFLGVMMPSVAAGTAVYPVMTNGGAASMRAANQAVDAGSYALTTVNVNPKRASTRYLLNVENQAEVGEELEGVLRADLREQLGQILDQQALNGDAQGANIGGILQALTTPDDPDSVATAISLRSGIIDAVDNKWVRSESSVRLLMAISAYRFARKVWQDTDQTIDGIEAMTRLGASVQSSTRIPQKSASIQYGIRTARPDGFVVPVWQGVTIIRDPYTKAAAGQVALTAHMLFGAAFKRSDGWAQVAFKLS